MVPFAGWEMPVQYQGVIPEHRAVRTDCGVFDVSHMGQLEVAGPRAFEFLQLMLSNDLNKVLIGGAQYSLLTNERGGIVDDLIVYRLEESRFLIVVNASNRATDFRWLKERALPGSSVCDLSDEYALVAVQGPRSLERLGLESAPAFTFFNEEIGGVPCMVCCTGYTGELGVELLCLADNAPRLWDHVSSRGAVPCGLGARDTLRLEVCYPLHGNDISPETDAISAGLGWVCALDKDFTGVEVLRRVKAEGPTQRLAAFVMDDAGIPRHGMPIPPDGRVTSGTHSPMLGRGIGMGYIASQRAAPGTGIAVEVRGRRFSAHVVKKPVYERESP